MPETSEDRVEHLDYAVQELENAVKRALDRLRMIQCRRDTGARPLG